MDISIKELVIKSGERLFNVPADTSVLTELGFTLNEAEQLCRDAIKAEKWKVIRSQRDNAIASCDWSQMPDSPLSDEKKADFAVYRQALRDLPQSTDNPDEIVWPVKPE